MTKQAFLLFTALLVPACISDVPGDEGRELVPSITYIDTDGDGRFDGVDVDGDGIPNYRIPPVDELPVGLCWDPLVDNNRDGRPEGLDWNCDGNIDARLERPDLAGGTDSTGRTHSTSETGSTGGTGSTGTASSRCTTSVFDNGELLKIDCTSSGGTYSCNCYVDDTLVQTCTTSSSNACSYPTGGCCSF